MANKDEGNRIIPMGKHKGYTFNDVIDSTPGYFLHCYHFIPNMCVPLSVLNDHLHNCTGSGMLGTTDALGLLSTPLHSVRMTTFLRESRTIPAGNFINSRERENL